MLYACRSSFVGNSTGENERTLTTTWLLAGPTRLLAHRVLVEGARLPHGPQLHGHSDLYITREDERARQPREAVRILRVRPDLDLCRKARATHLGQPSRRPPGGLAGGHVGVALDLDGDEGGGARSDERRRDLAGSDVVKLGSGLGLGLGVRVGVGLGVPRR